VVVHLQFLHSFSRTLAYSLVLVACGVAFGAEPDVAHGSLPTGPASTTLGSLPSQSPDTQALQQAREAFNEGRFNDALALYQQVAKLQPNNSAAFDGIGRSYERLAELSPFPGRLAGKARKNYQIALTLNPRNTDALQDLIEMHTVPVGVCYGNLDEAALLVEQLNGIDPTLGEVSRFRLHEAVSDSRTPEMRARCGYQSVTKAVEKVVGIPKSGVTSR
jgi:tetratricopeptide (TPR) repeat protein